MSETDAMPAAAFRCLREIRAHNDREWMRANSDRVRRQLTEPFVRILHAASERLSEAGIDLEGGAGTVFRMQRDVRFVADRTPFHPWIEGVLSKGGRRIGNRAAIHLRCSLDGGFLRAGSFLLPPAGTRAVREAMVARRERFLEIARQLDAGGRGLTSDARLSRGPRGFEDERDGPLAPYLRMRSPLAETRLTQRAWRDASLVDGILEFAAAVRPWLLFLEESLQGVEDATPRPPRRPPVGSATSPSEIGR